MAKLVGAQEHHLVVEIERRLDLWLQCLPTCAARTFGLQQEIIGGIFAEHPIEAAFPVRSKLRNEMAVFEKQRRKEKAARVRVDLDAIAKPPAQIRAVIGRREEVPRPPGLLN